MRAALWLVVQQLPQMLWGCCLLLWQGSWKTLWRRLLVVAVGLPLLLLLQMVHWVGFVLDELFFRRYRQTAILAPIFITGVPRSGTTHLQRVMAHHEGLTTTATWECLLAPSITEKYIYRGIGKLIAPIAKKLSGIQLPFIAQMQSIHKLGIEEPEEDFLLLLPINACFLLVLVFPGMAQYWQLAHFEQHFSLKQRQTIMQFYALMVQKHLYALGGGRRYLSKNPSFCSWVPDLQAQFPDADIILCTRPAEKAVISQFSSLLPGWQMIHGQDQWSPDFEQRIIDMLVGYYQVIEQMGGQADCTILPMKTLVSEPQKTITELLTQTDVPMTDAFAKQLQQEAEKAKRYKSQHRYQTSACHHDWADISHRFMAFGR